MRKTIVVDLDGTLSDARYRVHLAQIGQWHDFHVMGADDPVHEDVAELIAAIVPIDYRVIILTGRNEAYRGLTEKWLREHALSGYIDALLMRPDWDYTPDRDLKPRLLSEWHAAQQRHLGHEEVDVKSAVAFILEDRDGMVERWRELGFNCWQVRHGGY
jgi:phosphoglycolate phosphatase-like HAD superfamily hydrolase